MKKTIPFFFALALCVGNAYSQSLLNAKDSISYAYGVLFGTNLKRQGATDLNFNLFLQALQGASTGAATVMDVSTANKIATEFSTKQREIQGKKQIAEGNAFLEENKKRKGVYLTNSGLQYEVITVGTGDVPKATDQVKVHYHGTLLDGTVFDSSVQRGQPAIFPVNAVIAGWVEALQMMSVGSKWKLFIPYNLAYGDRSAGANIPPYSTLIFEVELLEIVK